MAWDNAVVTNGGIAMLGQLPSGGTLTIDGAAGGAGTVPPAALMAQTALTDQKQQMPVIGIADVPDGKKLNILVTSQSLAAGYTLRQVGIWAHIDSDSSSLFAILQDAAGIAIPSSSEMPDFALNFYAVIDFTNEGDVSIVVDPSALVSVGMLDAAIEAEAAAREAGDDETLGEAKGYADGLITDLSVTLTDAAGSDTLPPAGVGLLATVMQTVRNNLKSLFASLAGKAPMSHAATETTYGAASTTSYGHMRFATDAEVNTGTATDKAVTPKQLKTGLDGVITVQTVTIPASAWTSANPSTATVAVEGMTADMTQDKFDVRGLSAAQAPVEASAGLGNTDIVPGDGTIKLTCIGVVPTTEIKIVVTIRG